MQACTLQQAVRIRFLLVLLLLLLPAQVLLVLVVLLVHLVLRPHLRHGVQGGERRRQHVPVLQVVEEAVVAGELEHLRDGRRRRRHRHL